MNVNQKMRTVMERAEHALMVYVGGLVTKEIIDCCLGLLDKGLALELFLDADNKMFLQEHPFVLNKCFQLVNRGGSIFLVSTEAKFTSWECVIDFKQFSYALLGDDEVIREDDQDQPLVKNALLNFDKKRQEAQPYLVEKGDIQIRFNVSDRLVIAGDQVELTWEVDRAEKVIVQGLGEVESYGRRNIFLKKDTILKVGAFNERQSQIKALLVRVFEGDIEILYDIGFTKSGTSQYYSLVNSTIYPHVYGISTGNQVKLTWNVAQATSVMVKPFNITEASGAYVFTPSSSLIIEIQATIKDKTFIRKIQVILFPIPLFKEKLITPFQMKYVAKQRNMTTGISPDKIDEIFEVEKKRYVALTNKIGKYYLATGSKKINLRNIHFVVFDFLKRKYLHRKRIVDEIKSIQSYYERPTTRKGIDKRFF